MNEPNKRESASTAGAASDTDNRVAPIRAPGRKKVTDEQAIPDEVRRWFKAEGDRYRTPDGEIEFRDRGEVLTSRSDHALVARAFVAIAEARGWSTVKAEGSDRFRERVRQEAHLRGLAVLDESRRESPHEPTQPALSAPDANKTVETVQTRTLVREKAPDPDTERFAGKLVDYGPARYQHREDRPMSYFVTLKNEHQTRTVWGVDLERALRESASNPQRGDAVELQRVGRRVVTVKSAERDTAGEWVTREKAAYRNGWVLETEEFMATRRAAAAALRDQTLGSAETVAKHPQLTGSAIYIKVAQEVAEKTFTQQEDRQRFVEGVRESLAAGIERGEAWPTARLRVRATERDRTREPTLARER